MFPLKDNVPTRSFPVVTVALIAINFAVWIFYQLPHLNRSVVEYAYQPCEVVASCPPGTAVGHGWFVTAFTSMFMHGSWLHIIGNMLFLWIFGNNVCVSLMLGAARFGMRFVAAVPEGYDPDENAVTAAKRAAVQMGGTVELTRDPREAARRAALTAVGSGS